MAERDVRLSLVGLLGDGLLLALGLTGFTGSLLDRKSVV